MYFDISGTQSYHFLPNKTSIRTAKLYFRKEKNAALCLAARRQVLKKPRSVAKPPASV